MKGNVLIKAKWRACIALSMRNHLIIGTLSKIWTNRHGIVTETKVYQASIVDHCNLPKYTYVHYYFIKYLIAPDCFVTSQ